MSKTINLVLSPSQQVIPVNDAKQRGSGGFIANVQVKANPPTGIFEGFVISEGDLAQMDEKGALPFQQSANGTFSATIEQLDSSPGSQLWYLVLRAAQNLGVSVMIQVTPVSSTLQGTPTAQLGAAPAAYAATGAGQQIIPSKGAQPGEQTKKRRFPLWLVIIGLVIVGAVLYFVFIKKAPVVSTPAQIVIPPVVPALPTELPPIEMGDEVLAQVNSLPPI